VPEQNVRAPGQLAQSTGVLQALAVLGAPNYETRIGQTVGSVFDVEWVDIDEPDPVTDTVREEAQSKGAAMFDRQEGMWVGGGRIYFDCTSAGDAGFGQIWELDAVASTLTLIYESPGPKELKNPDNIVVTPFGHLFLQEDSAPPQHVRGLTPEDPSTTSVGRRQSTASSPAVVSTRAGASSSSISRVAGRVQMP
jgi:secreted PhoX family phosphatase